MDFRQCQLVVSFDPPDNTLKFIQTRWMGWGLGSGGVGVGVVWGLRGVGAGVRVQISASCATPPQPQGRLWIQGLHVRVIKPRQGRGCALTIMLWGSLSDWPPFDQALAPPSSPLAGPSASQNACHVTQQYMADSCGPGPALTLISPLVASRAELAKPPRRRPACPPPRLPNRAATGAAAVRGTPIFCLCTPAPRRARPSRPASAKRAHRPALPCSAPVLLGGGGGPLQWHDNSRTMR